MVKKQKIMNTGIFCARFEPLSITITELTDFTHGDDFQKNAKTGNFKGAPWENYKELLWTCSVANVAN